MKCCLTTETTFWCD